LDEDYAKKYQTNVLFDLWHLERFEELQQRIASAKQSDAARQLLIASIALKDSPDAAAQRVRSLASDRTERVKLFAASANQLMRRRKYKEAGALFRAAAADADNAAPFLNIVSVLDATKRLDRAAIDASDPVGALMSYTLTMADGSATVDRLRSVHSKRLLDLMS